MDSDSQALRSLARSASQSLSEVVKRIDIPLTPTSPPGLVEANTVDPWRESGKYGLGWTFFALALTGTVLLTRGWHFWQDKIRQAMYKQEFEQHNANTYDPEQEWQQTHSPTSGTPKGRSARQFFPEDGAATKESMESMDFRPNAHLSSIGLINDTLALFRWVFYRPIPDLVWRKHRFTFSSLAVLTVVLVTAIFVALYCFLLQPLFWHSIRFGAPPVAVRAGMIAIAMTPWIIATSMKANLLTLLTGIGPERLNVFHRWAGYACLFLALVHTVPFYVQPVWNDNGLETYSKVFPEGSGAVYGTGIACLVPLVWLCIASLPFIRRVAYEIFVVLHIPVGLVYIAVLFWHTKNFLASWNYLIASLAIFILCSIMRLFNLNWTKPWRLSFMVGDEASISLMTENTIKVTVPTQMRWRPGQFVYLRMPAISLFENHPFTISSLCSEDFPSEYGEEYRDCVLVFRPYGGFTRRVLEKAIENGPFHTYRAFLDGPYGGMRRDLAAFDTCILIAGGSGITALMSQLLNLIKRMRDGKAITKRIVVVWALKRLEAMDWFREELRICREAAPPESVTCRFFVTAAVRQQYHNVGKTSVVLRQKDHLQRHSMPPRPPEALVDQGDREKAVEASLRRLEGTDRDAEPETRRTEGRPEKHQGSERDAIDDRKGFYSPPLKNLDVPTFQYAPPGSPGHATYSQCLAAPHADGEQMLLPQDSNQYSSLPASLVVVKGPSAEAHRPPELAHLCTDLGQLRQPCRPISTLGSPADFDFGSPGAPTEVQKSLERFGFTVPHQIDGGWSVEYGRPDLGYMLKEWATGGADGRGILSRRTAVFVCGPPAMRVGVANTVARLQAEIWGDDLLEEIFLHTENYAL